MFFEVLATSPVQAEIVAHGDQPGSGHRVAAGEQGDVVAVGHQLLGEIRNHPLGPAV